MAREEPALRARRRPVGGLVGERSASRGGCATRRPAAARGSPRDGAPHAISEAFFTASLLFCVGPLTVIGSFQDGLTRRLPPLATKSLLDGFASIALAPTLGPGVALAAGTVLVVQGALTLGAGLFDGLLRGEALARDDTTAGGVLIIGIALKLLELKDVKVGNFLPALVLAPPLVGIVSLFG